MSAIWEMAIRIEDTTSKLENIETIMQAASDGYFDRNPSEISNHDKCRNYKIIADLFHMSNNILCDAIKEYRKTSEDMLDYNRAMKLLTEKRKEGVV
jgi:hypothetical protein